MQDSTLCRAIAMALLVGGNIGMLWCDHAQAVVIDDFSSGPIVLTASSMASTPQLQSGLDTASVIRGERRWTVQAYSIVGPSPLTTVTVDALFGEMKLQTAASNNGSLRLQYGAYDDQLAQLAVDLTAGGHNQLRIDFRELPADPAKILSFVISADTVGPGISGTSRSFLNEIRQLGTSGTLYVPYSLLPTPNFADIDILGLTISVAANTTVAITDIRTVPEPSGASMLVFAAMVVLKRRIRRPKSKGCSQKRSDTHLRSAG